MYRKRQCNRKRHAPQSSKSRYVSQKTDFIKESDFGQNGSGPLESWNLEV
jgi:hypothetical protein